jgi:P4 family phage/plasmid primase-like protien
MRSGARRLVVVKRPREAHGRRWAGWREVSGACPKIDPRKQPTKCLNPECFGEHTEWEIAKESPAAEPHWTCQRCGKMASEVVLLSLSKLREKKGPPASQTRPTVKRPPTSVRLVDPPAEAEVKRPVGEVFLRGDHVELGERMNTKLTAGGEPVVFDAGAVHKYDPPTGVWGRVDANLESRTMQEFAGARVGRGDGSKALKLKASDVSGAIKLAHDQAARPGFFAAAPPGVAFKNCFVRVEPDRIVQEEHQPSNRATVGLSFDYDPCSPYPRWYAFLEEIFAGDPDSEEKRALLQEFAGGCFLGLATRYQRAVVLLGEGDNGKSVVINVISAAFPSAARAAIPPQDWEQEYRRAMLAGVRLNALSELPEQDILASEAFKAVITGDEIVGRHIRESPFLFRPVAGHLFAANQLPGTSDLTEGFWRRLVVLNFRWRCPPERKDPDLASTIIRDELPGIVGWLLEGAARLVARGRYVIPDSSAEAVNEWRRGADTVGLFLEECTTTPLNEDHWTQSSELYAGYREWGQKNGFRPVSVKKFAARMRALGKGCEKRREANSYPAVLKHEFRPR